MAEKITDLLGSYDNLDEEPDYLNNPTNILAVTITFMILSWICALLRLYTRFFIVRSPGWDDVFVILSLISTSIGSGGICAAATMGGMGQHYLLLPEETMIEYLRVFYVANASYPCSAGLIKLALLFQYLRVYERGTRLRMAVIATIVFVGLWGLAYGLLGWIPCVPVSAYWNLTMPAVRFAYGSLYVEPFVVTYTSMTASNMVLDMIILGLAGPILLYNKTADKRARWSLLCLFSVGSIASIISIFRLESIVRTRAATYPTFDPTWYGAKPIVLAALEVDIATITAALPVFWPVLKNLSINQILVTHEVKVTLEHRRLSSGKDSSSGADRDDDGIELHPSRSGLQQFPSGGHGDGSHATISSGHVDYYQDAYILQQIDPLRDPSFGTRAEIGVVNEVVNGATVGERKLSVKKKRDM